MSLQGLNPPQREAVLCVDGPLLVLAGAGSGKTRVITYRVAHLLELGVPPSEILAVSFTNKAAEEMRERVEKLVGARRAEKLTLSTFHALGLQILKAEKVALDLRTGFTVYDAADQLGVVRECLRTIRVDDRRFDAKAIQFRISRAKNAFLSPEELAARGSKDGDDYDLVTERVYPLYQQALRSFHAFDFDDLIVEPVRLFDADEAVRRRWQARYRYLMVDEYQDTNRTQLKLVRHLCAAHGNLCVVGDDDQSIYAWRGAEADNILDFERHFPGAKKITLEQNYRSTPTILAAANAVILNNGRRHDKKLFTTNSGQERIAHVVADDPEAEASFVAEEIDLLRATAGYKASDFAILYRSNIQSRPFEEALRTQRIEYRMIGGQAFFERKEVKDAIAYLKAALNPRDEISLRRVINYPARGIGDSTVERCAQHAAGTSTPTALFSREKRTTLWEALHEVDYVDGIPPKAREAIHAFVAMLERHRPALATGKGVADTARALVEETGLREDINKSDGSDKAKQRRKEHLEGFFAGLERWEERQGGKASSLADYLHRLTLASDDDDDGDEGDSTRATLVTLHGAKGLEFKVVFLVGLEEELLPHKRTLNPTATDASDATVDISEERRLLYVGITRARERLYLTRCRHRSSREVEKPRSPSRFLDEVPAELLDVRDAAVAAPMSEEQKQAVAKESLAKMFAMLK